MESFELSEETTPTIETSMLEHCRPQKPALLVGGTAGRGGTLAELGREAIRCPGPASVRCPVLLGGRCELREEAALAVIRIPPFASSAPRGSLPYLPCALAGESPALVLLGGRTRPLTIHGRVGVMGDARGPEAVAAATERVSSCLEEDR